LFAAPTTVGVLAEDLASAEARAGAGVVGTVGMAEPVHERQVRSPRSRMDRIAAMSNSRLSRRDPARRPGGFTLIELLVVIAIVALLVTILVPSLRQAKVLAQAAVCMSSLRSIGSGAFVYCGDTGGYMPAAVQGVGNYHTRHHSRFDYMFGGEYATGGIFNAGAFPYDVTKCTEEPGGAGRTVTDNKAYTSGTLPKNFGDTLCDKGYAGDSAFYCPANRPGSRGYPLNAVYDTSTSPWTYKPELCDYSTKPEIFGYAYLISLTHYSWDYSYHGELPGQKGGAPYKRHGVCDPWKFRYILHPQEGCFIVDNSAPNTPKIDSNYWGGSTKHNNAGVNVLHFDGHVALRDMDELPEMFFNYSEVYRSGGHVNSFHYCRMDPDPLWRPWFRNFPITSVLDARNQ